MIPNLLFPLRLLRTYGSRFLAARSEATGINNAMEGKQCEGSSLLQVSGFSISSGSHSNVRETGLGGSMLAYSFPTIDA